MLKIMTLQIMNKDDVLEVIESESYLAATQHVEGNKQKYLDDGIFVVTIRDKETRDYCNWKLKSEKRPSILSDSIGKWNL